MTADWREKNPDVEPSEILVEKSVDKFSKGKSTGRAASPNIIAGRAALSVGNPNTTLPRLWTCVPLLKVARLESGHTPSRKHPEYWNGEIPWIGIADAREHHGQRINITHQCTNELGLQNSAARLLPKNTVCLSRTASVGYTVIMNRPMATSQDFVNWVCGPAINPEFLLLVFLAEGEHLLRFGKGTTHTTIYFPEVKAFHITLPPIEEQEKIIQLVHKQMEKIKLLNNYIADIQAEISIIDQSILSKAFRGELVPQDPNDEPVDLLLDRIRAEREKLTSKKKTKRPRNKKSTQQLTLEGT